jgi:hypothetical protein
MATNSDEQGFAHLQKVNEALNNSLARCRDLLKKHRTELAANQNHPGVPEGRKEADEQRGP